MNETLEIGRKLFRSSGPRSSFLSSGAATSDLKRRVKLVLRQRPVENIHQEIGSSLVSKGYDQDCTAYRATTRSSSALPHQLLAEFI